MLTLEKLVKYFSLYGARRLKKIIVPKSRLKFKILIINKYLMSNSYLRDTKTN